MQDTLDLVKKVLNSSDNISKAITTSTGLVAYDLQAPAKNLYPVATPVRNSLPRVGGGTGTATNWRVVSAIIGSGFNAMPWVPEGQRSANMSYVTANKAASYVTIGEEDYVTREAINAGRTFEDVKSRMVLRLLQKMMLKEEMALLFGNNSVALGTCGTVTTSASGSGATLPAATYYVSCVPLTYEGIQQQTVAAGLVQSKTITGMDQATYTLNGGVGQQSAQASQAITLGQILTLSVVPVRGAAGYAWFVGTAAGTSYLQAITTTAQTTFSAPILAAGQLSTALTAADYSTNTLAFDGIVTAALNSSSGAIWTPLANGALLTTNGSGNVNEIDALFLSMWNAYQVSPSVLYVNAQQAKDIKNRILNNASAPLLRYTTNGDNGFGIVANGEIKAYFNPFCLGGGREIPIKIHPNMAAGTILGYAEDLPAQFQSSEVPNICEVKTRADYYELDWPLRTRREEVGVYAEEVPAIYAPFGIGVVNNITAG
jgi:hypothetical protein